MIQRVRKFIKILLSFELIAENKIIKKNFKTLSYYLKGLNLKKNNERE